MQNFVNKVVSGKKILSVCNTLANRKGKKLGLKRVRLGRKQKQHQPAA